MRCVGWYSGDWGHSDGPGDGTRSIIGLIKYHMVSKAAWRSETLAYSKYDKPSFILTIGV